MTKKSTKRQLKWEIEILKARLADAERVNKQLLETIERVRPLIDPAPSTPAWPKPPVIYPGISFGSPHLVWPHPLAPNPPPPDWTGNPPTELTTTWTTARDLTGL